MFSHALKTLIQYLRAPATRSAEEFGDAIEEEITFHLASRTQEYMTGGMSADGARRAALKRFGDATRVAVECQAAEVRRLATWHRLHLAITTLLFISVGVFCLTSMRPEGGRLALSQLPPGIVSLLDNDWSGDVTGRILDERGRPIDAAHVLVVVKTWPDHSYFQRAYAVVTGPDGQFLIEDVHSVTEPFAVQIAVVAEKRVLKSAYHRRTAGQLKPLVFELPPSTGLALRVEAEGGGERLAGVEVLPHVRVESSGAEHLVYFDSAQPIVRQTNDEGRVELPYFQPGDKVSVMLRMPQGEWESRDIIVPAAGKIATIRASRGEEHIREES